MMNSNLKCNWKRAEVVFGNIVQFLPKGSRKQTGTWMCADCKQWTSNLPLYKNEICEKKDRRKGLEDRRRK